MNLFMLILFIIFILINANYVKKFSLYVLLINLNYFNEVECLLLILNEKVIVNFL